MEMTPRIKAAEIAAQIMSAPGYNAPSVSSAFNALHEIVLASFEEPKPVEAPAKITPFMDPRKANGKDAMICLCCGAKFKSLKRHILAHHGLTPDAYREQFDLPASYPMVAASYSETRSRLAKQSGLGHKVEVA